MSLFGDPETPQPQLAELSVHVFSAVVPSSVQDVRLHAEAKTAFVDENAGAGVRVGFFVNGRKIKEAKTDEYGLALIDESFSRNFFNDKQNSLVVRVPGFPREAADSFDLQLPPPEPVALPAPPPPPPRGFDWSSAAETMENSIGMKFALIRPGRFKMGPQHGRELVRIDHPFFLAAYPTTQSEFLQVMGYNPSYFSASGQGSDKIAGLDTSRFPVEQVNAEEVQEFCRVLSDLPDERKGGWVYRIPTPQEWEYACRAGTTTVYTFGNSLSIAQANFYSEWNEEEEKACEGQCTYAKPDEDEYWSDEEEEKAYEGQCTSSGLNNWGFTWKQAADLISQLDLHPPSNMNRAKWERSREREAYMDQLRDRWRQSYECLLQNVCAKGVGAGRPTPVGSYPSNAWGLYDMHGNISEMCSGGQSRGGHWDDTNLHCTSGLPSTRLNASVHQYSGHLGYIGFRVLRTPADS